MKLVSWNVNGIRSVLKKGFVDFVGKYDPDVLCLQETKTPSDWADLKEFEGFEQFWNHAQKPGYAGTAVFSKIKPQKITLGLGIAGHDREGRVITAEFPDFFLVNVYVPNSQRTLERLPYRTREWDMDFLGDLKKLEKTKPVIVCGDMNVAHAEIDLTYPKANVKNHGFTPEERAGFQKMADAGFIYT